MATETLALFLLFSPLVAFFVALVMFRDRHAVASGVVVVAGLATALAAVALLLQGDHEALTYRWFHISGVDIEFGVLLDGRTLLMGAVVGVVALCIQIYSLGYMADDPGRGRFFSFLALFEWAMLSFVYAPNLLQTFIFWELVGLASFFLIGFWYHKPSAVAAAKKAFIMTRIGDVGLFVGLILLFQSAGTLSIESITQTATAGVVDNTELIAALLLMGIVGKSAQFPLHTWLPDAMEGPTPVSALLHSATMVAAGVFLFARFHELFMDAETVRSAALVIATITALLASTMAVVAKDMKRILAFSSISQLGFMLLGLAAGSLFAGFFHLTTHAFFKALLFLVAGAYIHHVGSNDIVAIGRAGAAKAMKVTTAGLIIGGAALAGIPPLAGFWSKEHIVSSLGEAGMPFMIGALAAAFLTAYYTFRMIFLVVRPDPDSAAEADEPAGAQHASHGPVHDADDHDSHDDHHDHPAEPWTMALPIAVLTVGALIAGFFGGTIADTLAIEFPSLGDGIGAQIAHVAPAVAIALLGVAAAYLEFGRKGAAQTGLVSRSPGLHRLLANRWYLDAIYRRTVVALALGVARLMYGTETHGFDGGADKIASGTIVAGRGTARGHSGRLQLYVGGATILVALAAAYLGLRG